MISYSEDDDPAMIEAYKINLFRFSGVKTLSEAEKANFLFREAGSFRQFFKLLDQMLESVDRNVLEEQYHLAFATGCSASDYHRFMGSKDVFPYLKVAAHENASIDGIVMHCDNPIWMRFWPPFKAYDSTYITPAFRNEAPVDLLTDSEMRANVFMKSAEFKRIRRMQFGVNRGVPSIAEEESKKYKETLEL